MKIIQDLIILAAAALIGYFGWKAWQTYLAYKSAKGAVSGAVASVLSGTIPPVGNGGTTSIADDVASVGNWLDGAPDQTDAAVDATFNGPGQQNPNYQAILASESTEPFAIPQSALDWAPAS